jgi:threonine/homoserine/homoserine lactone efflux protein
MFDYSLVHWTTFFAAAALLSLSPGPDLAFILGHTATGGRQSGFIAMFGVWAGAFLHVLLAAMGLSAILATSIVAFTVVKWIGAAYLIWLGLSYFKSKGEGFLATDAARPHSRRIFRQGALVSALNPKVAIFFLAFLPQFVVEGTGPVWAQLLLHGSLTFLVAAFIEPPLIIAGSKLAGATRNSKLVGKWLDRGAGAVLVALGVRLALSER